MAEASPHVATRLCPGCRAPDPVAEHEPLWPQNWQCQSCGNTLTVSSGIVALAPEFAQEDAGFDAEAFKPLATLEAGHFWFIARNTLIGWLVTRFAPDTRRALEIGCGTGFVLNEWKKRLPGAQIAASELSPSGLRHAIKRHASTGAEKHESDHPIELFQMDARQPYLVDTLDLIGAFDVLEHIPHDDVVIAALATALKPGGILMASVPQHPWMWSTADDLAMHQRRYSRGELAQKMRAAGLEPIYQTSFVALPFPLMVLSRAAEWLRAKPKSLTRQVEDEFMLPAWQSRMLLALLAVEHRLRRIGLPLPIGGSQVVVARKPLTAG
jgi:SAM-dependent methyltransferase